MEPPHTETSTKNDNLSRICMHLLVRNGMDVNEHERLSNIALRQKLK